jgi:hypothetical protein
VSGARKEIINDEGLSEEASMYETGDSANRKLPREANEGFVFPDDAS